MDTKFSPKVKAMAKLKIIIFFLLIDLHITTSQNFNINLTSLPKVCGIGPSSRGQSLGFRFVAKGSDAEIHDVSNYFIGHTCQMYILNFISN